ncbi:MAG: hypothetical protein GY842_11650, partial [bacterium]|nr:hypothetical protein [bacterium]
EFRQNVASNQTGAGWAIYLSGEENAVVEDNVLDGSYRGLWVRSSTLSGPTVPDSNSFSDIWGVALQLEDCADMVLDLDLPGGHGTALGLRSCTNITVQGLDLSGDPASPGGTGIKLENTSGSAIIGNNLSNRTWGIRTYSGIGNEFRGNNVSNQAGSGWAIYLSGEENAVAEDNVLDGSRGGLWLKSSTLNVPTVPASNSFAGIYGVALRLEDCTAITVQGLDLSGDPASPGGNGIDLVNTSNSSIIGNDVSYRSKGINASSSENNEFWGNTVASCLTRGIVLTDCPGTRVYRNNIYGNGGWPVSSNTAIELSYQNEGNFWGRSCPDVLFVAGVDTDSLDVVDSYPYGVEDAWLYGIDPGCGPTSPNLTIPTGVVAVGGVQVAVPVALTSVGLDLAGTAFSIDYDQDCLSFDATDANGDGIPDSLQVLTTPEFTVMVISNPDDLDGEIDISIADLGPPVATLGDGPLVAVTLAATCTPSPGSTLIAPVGFSSEPVASFSDVAAQNIPGTTTNGSVVIYPGLRGDCNGDGSVAVADLVAVGYEIFDGDGNFWLDVPGGTFPGFPAGCDSNGDTAVEESAVDAGDVSCINRLIFDLGCGGTTPEFLYPPPELSLDGELAALPGVSLSIPVDFQSQGNQINSLAFSIDIDPARLQFDPSDNDGDGVPDAVYFPGGLPPLATITVDLGDGDGEIDFLLGNLGGTLGDGLLFEIEFQAVVAGVAAQGIGFSRHPAASFGNTVGLSVEGRATVTGVDLFADGFESGILGAWSSSQP